MTIITTESSPTAERVRTKFARMEGSRVNWESHWQDLANFIMPDKDNVFKSNVNGEKKHNKIFTGMPVHANEELAAVLHGTLTNPATMWFGMATGDKTLDSNIAVKTWLQHVRDRMIQTMNQTNFQTQIHEVYLDLGCFGTSLLLVEEDDEFVINFLSRPIYMAFIEENAKGRIDTVAFERPRTLRQIVDEFGMAAIEGNDDLVNQLTVDDTREYRVIHMVEPRSSFDPEKKDQKNKAFSSVHMIKDVDHVLKESGFNEMPYVVTRWSKISGEVYGRSPGMKALPDVKMLNAMKKVVIQGAQKVVDPALQVPDDGVLLPLKTAPGSINYYRAGSKDRIEPLLTGSRPDIGESLIKGVEEDIRAAFFLDKTQIREGDRMTTVEVRQRVDEQLRTLGPLLGRQHFELLRPLVDRVFSIMMRKDMFDAPPEILEGVTLEVQYTSQIAKAQRTADSDDLARVMQLIGPVAQAKPAMIDNFNEDQILRDLVDKFGLPSDYLHKKTDVAKIRKGRAEAQKEQQELENTNAQVEIAGKASKIGE